MAQLRSSQMHCVAPPSSVVRGDRSFSGNRFVRRYNDIELGDTLRWKGQENHPYGAGEEEFENRPYGMGISFDEVIGDRLRDRKEKRFWLS